MTSKSKTQRDFFKQVSTFSSASLLTQAITLVAAILTRRFLGPVQTGVWSILQVILTYSAYTTLGTMDAATREIPSCKGRGDVSKADRIKNLVFTFGVLSAVIVAVGILIYAFVNRDGFNRDVYIGLLFASILVVLQRINNLQIVFLRAYKHFNIAAQQMIWSAIANALLVAFFAYRFKLHGFMIAMMLSFIFNIAFVARKRVFKLMTWVWNKELLIKLIKLGMPLLILTALSGFLMTVDRLLVARFLGFEATGLYSIAIMVNTYLASFPNSIGIVLIPNFEGRYGEKERIEHLKPMIDKLRFAFTIIMPALIGIAWLLVPLFLKLLLPDFIKSLWAVRFLLLSSFFFALVQPYWNLMIVMRKHLFLIPMMSFALIAALVLSYFAIKIGFGIEGVALTMTFVTFLEFRILFFIASRYLLNRAQRIYQYGLTLLMLFSVIIILSLLEMLTIKINGLPQPLIKAVLFLVVYSPFLVVLERKIKVLPLVKQKIYGAPPEI